MANKIGVKIPNIVMPKKGTDMSKWAVVACDQYTSQPDYWEACETFVGSSPSTLNLILPELYLETPDEHERIERVNRTMESYVADGTVEEIGEGFMLVKRTVDNKTRVGLVMALDLECYDYSKGSSSLIRATEGTIVERIPPRLRIRKDALLELPHILVLIDDENRTVIEPIAKKYENADPYYDFELMQGGGHIKGTHISDKSDIESVILALEALADEDKFKAKYGDEPLLLFAMGDGNHSFATAKANWENVKATLSDEEKENHPARFALVELENVHDEGIIFEPIHRILFNLDVKNTLSTLAGLLAATSGDVKIYEFEKLEECEKAMSEKSKESHLLPFSHNGGFGFFEVKEPSAQLAVGTLQNALDILLKGADYKDTTIDYVHGADVVYDISSKPFNLGFILPPMEKSELFPTVIYDGALPRKTFSMGEAHEKRFYLECKSIKNK
ncbi:MAG: DUF1015 domain-containing protein [Clostridia bacterium]|nr:DUF1015 domain-containing protein [Clostridia bacterium]